MQFELPAWATKAVSAIATATVIGGGTMVLNSHKDNARQDQELHSLQQSVGRIDALSDKLDETNKNLAELNGYMRGQRDAHKEK